MDRRNGAIKNAIFDNLAIAEIPQYGLLISATVQVKYNDWQFLYSVAAREKYTPA
jgi:hypothetical protein